MSAVWIILIVVVAVVLFFWLVFGINWRSPRNYSNIHRRMREQLQAENNDEINSLLFGKSYEQHLPKHYRPLAEILSQDGRPTVNTSTEIEVITSGARKYDLLMQDLQNAKEYIHFEYFHFGIDKGSRAVRRMLMQKAKEGVKVRFINENLANFPIPNIYFYSMRKAGVEVRNFTNTGFSLLRFLMTLSYRDHRKIVVIDGRIGYTGGMNINDHYFRMWRDTHLRLVGNSVAQLQFAFLDTWLFAKGRLDKPLHYYFPMAETAVTPSNNVLTQIVPDDPTSPSPVLQTAYEWILNHAQRYVWIQSPYLAPPPSLIDAMRNAVQRGVEVKIMMPEYCDTPIMRPFNRAFCLDCLQAGVKIFIRHEEFMHSKTIIADDNLTMIGTTNLDNRSFGIDFEIDSFFYDAKFAEHNKAIFEQDMNICHELTLTEHMKTSRLQRFLDKKMQRLAPLV